MGFTPAEVGAMSFWQFAACVDGWNRANGGEDSVEPPSREEYEDLVRRLN